MNIRLVRVEKFVVDQGNWLPLDVSETFHDLVDLTDNEPAWRHLWPMERKFFDPIIGDSTRLMQVDLKCAYDIRQWGDAAEAVDVFMRRYPDGRVHASTWGFYAAEGVMVSLFPVPDGARLVTLSLQGVQIMRALEGV